MKVAFVSNYLNHHQLPFCKALINLTKGQFVFIATIPTPENRLQIGYHEMNEKYSFVICAYKNDEVMKQAIDAICDADTVIAGSAPEKLIRDRIDQGKILFRYSERLYKQGYIYLFAPKRRKHIRKEHLACNDKPVYMLCASSYTAGDYALNKAYIGKCYKWGYFPEVKEQNLDMLMSLKAENKAVSILWAGRLIGWKHPDVAIFVAEKLKNEGYNFKLTIIGSGEMETQLKQMVRDKNLEKEVIFTGSLSPEIVRDYMELASIFLFTSDFQEGWGAVLNESMNSACAVVASDAVGSSGYLIEDGKNGFLYKSGNAKDLYLKTKLLMDDSEKRKQFGISAYKTMISVWNPEVAASRFIKLSEALIEGKQSPFTNGPCSAAENNYGGPFFLG